VDATALNILISLVTLVGGGILAYLKFFRADARQSSDGMYDKALRIIQSYETEAARKDQELNDLRRQFLYFQNRLQVMEQRNAALVHELAVAYKVPESFVELRLDGILPHQQGRH
jgi:hypothetical protein